MQCKNHPEATAVDRCVGCAEPFCANCLVELHGQKYCGSCKVMAVQTQPIIEEARTHTSPSIERSVLLRMGFSSIETKPIVNKMLEKGLLGNGAGRLVLRLAQKKGLSVREAGLGLMRDEYWEELP